MNKRVFIFGFVITLCAAFLFLFLNPSYQKSITAKYELYSGNYKDAYREAREAAVLDPYNKMAISVINQSGSALEYERYIKDAKTYLNDIVTIANSKSINADDRFMARLICEVMIDRFDLLRQRKYTPDTELYNEAKDYYEKFKEIYKKAF